MVFYMFIIFGAFFEKEFFDEEGYDSTNVLIYAERLSFGSYGYVHLQAGSL